MDANYSNFQEVIQLVQERELENVQDGIEKDKAVRQSLMRQSLGQEPAASQGSLHLGLSELLKASGIEAQSDPNAPGGLASLLDGTASADDEDNHESDETPRGFPAPPLGPESST